STSIVGFISSRRLSRSPLPTLNAAHGRSGIAGAGGKLGVSKSTCNTLEFVICLLCIGLQGEFTGSGHGGHMKDWQKETAWGVLLGAIILAVVLIWGVDGYLALLAIGVLIIVIGYPGISLLLLLLGLGR
ncbi:MAG: hypothetical protein LBB76_05815, partial [Azoarcus sp.]|nr:hypothetical protein [Azoarcus sp.]